ncbi:MAG: L,D-transpeptidase family protein [Nocardioides sp.]
MSRHRAPVRPRYGRLAAVTSALAITAIAVAGGFGMLSSAAGDDPSTAADLSTVAETPSPSPMQTPEPSSTPTSDPEPEPVKTPVVAAEPTLPPDSGTGRRVVFSEGEQRVWLVSKGTQVERTYPVSGSVYDNLDPGTYAVYSRSEQAWGIDDSGTMRYFVRFTQGDNAAIGFHDIPVAGGEPVQSVAQLGTPLSHGCIRQRRSDAVALWEFAPLGTTVVVTA